MSRDPRLKIAYLLAVGVAVFAVPGPPDPIFPAGAEPTWERLAQALAEPWGTAVIVSVLIVQPALAVLLRVEKAGLDRAARKLSPFLLLLLACFALWGPPASYVAHVPFGPWRLPWSPDGLVAGWLMACRILAIFWASQLVGHSGEPGEMVRGLQALGIPRLPALALDVTLSLLAGDTGESGPQDRVPGSGRGRPDGSGAGRGPGGGAGAALGDVLRGDIGILLRPVQAWQRRAERRAIELAPDLDPVTARDLAIVAGLAALSQSIRFVKILPGIPFAPGHKDVVLIPLYVVAAASTRTRWGATALGLTNGLLSFVFAQGRFGPFEILKFLAPGFAVDLLWPLAKGRGGLAFTVLGLVAAIAKFAGVVVVGLLAKAPPIFWAALAPMGIFYLVFGAMSGFVTYHLLRALEGT